MTRYSATLPSFPGSVFPSAAPAYAPTDPRVPKFAYRAYLLFFLLSVLNVVGLIILLFRFESLPIQPAIFAATFLLIAPWTKPKPYGIYFASAWALWIAFTVGGFLGSQREVSLADKALWQLIIKFWISIIGTPLLTLRILTKDAIGRLVKISLACLAFGGIMSMAELAYPKAFVSIVAQSGRGSGLWYNPNSCAEFLVIGMFLSLIYPFSKRYINLSLRAILLFGTLATLSRTGLLLLFIGFLTYGVFAKRWRALFNVAVVLIAVVVGGKLLVEVLRSYEPPASSQSKAAAKAHGVVSRLDRYAKILSGDVGVSSQDNDRMLFWKYAMEGIMRDPIIGLGHRVMDSIVPISNGLGPHNFYIYIWGNSGLIGLIAYLAFLCSLFVVASRCTQTTTRAALLAVMSMIAFISLVDHAFFNVITYGPVFALIVAIAYYGRKEMQPQQLPSLRPASPLPPQYPAVPQPRPA